MSTNHRSIFIGAWVAAAATLLPFSAALAADFPVGTYAAGPHVTIVFAKGGQFHVTEDKAVRVSGTYKAKGDQVELTDEEGPWACKNEGERTGTYSWKVSDAMLSFSKVNDPCGDRVGSLTRSTWKRAR